MELYLKIVKMVALKLSSQFRPKAKPFICIERQLQKVGLEMGGECKGQLPQLFYLFKKKHKPK
jgi:hypothetical protein